MFKKLEISFFYLRAEECDDDDNEKKTIIIIFTEIFIRNI